MTFHATKAEVANRGSAPDAWLTELVLWGKTAPEEIFAVRPSPPGVPDPDIYALLRPILGPWSSIAHRRAAMLEAMRVHAGFESSWNWNEGVDTTNQHSTHNPSGEETGAWQVSFDSTALAHSYMLPFAVAHNIASPDKFIPAMKANHPLAMEYYTRLVRVNTAWAGPLLRHKVDQWLSRDAVAEFQGLLALP